MAYAATVLLSVCLFSERRLVPAVWDRSLSRARSLRRVSGPVGWFRWRIQPEIHLLVVFKLPVGRMLLDHYRLPTMIEMCKREHFSRDPSPGYMQSEVQLSIKTCKGQAKTSCQKDPTLFDIKWTMGAPEPPNAQKRRYLCSIAA